MKKGFWFIAALLIALIGNSCGDSSTGDPLPKDGLFPAAKGKISVTDLEDFNGKYIYGAGALGGKAVIGFNDISGYPLDIAFNLVKIENNKADIPLYYANLGATSYADSYFAYEGNDSFDAEGSVNSFTLLVLDIDDGTSSMPESVDILTAEIVESTMTLKSGSFSNGNMSVSWTDDLDSLPHIVTNVDDLSSYLAGKKQNQANKPYLLTFTGNIETDFVGIVQENFEIPLGKIYSSLNGKYVALDFSACTGNLGNRSVESLNSFQYVVSVTLPILSTSIGTGAFYANSNLKEVILPPNLETIGGNAFANCSNLVEIDIPGSVTSIGKSFFYSARLARVIVRAETPPALVEDAFLKDNYNDFSIYVPDEKVTIYKGADVWNDYADYIKPISDL